MKCPKCSSKDDKVLETRISENGTVIRRRRECQNCHFRFTSYERIELRPITVIKKDGSFQAFNIEKISRGVRICTEKRNIDQEKIDELIHNIEDAVRQQAGPERKITSSAIGEETLKQLYKIDPVAYVRFAAVYRAYDSLEEFISEVNQLAKQAK